MERNRYLIGIGHSCSKQSHRFADRSGLVRKCFQGHPLRLSKITRMLSGTFPSFIKEQLQGFLNPFYTGNPNKGTLTKIEDPDEMQHNAAFHQGLHCLPTLKHSSVTVTHFNLENSKCDPLKYTMGSPILIVSVCMGKIHRNTMG